MSLLHRERKKDNELGLCAVTKNDWLLAAELSLRVNSEQTVSCSCSCGLERSSAADGVGGGERFLLTRAETSVLNYVAVCAVCGCAGV